MTSLIRWLHLSDFHVGKDDYAGRKMFDYIIEHVRQRKDEGFVPDFIFFTGDLTDKGKACDYETFWLEFVSSLQEVISGDISSRTFAVPGNHDADRDYHQAFSREEMSAPKSRYFDPNQEGNKLREILFPRFNAFVENDFSPTKGDLLKEQGAFAHQLDIRGNRIGIVGLNTAWLSKDNHDERKLTPGKALLEGVLDEISEAKVRIVLGHHPIDWFIPAEQKPLKSLLGKSHVLYLHGHLHDAWAEPTYGGGHQFLAIQSGAAFRAREGEMWRNGLVWAELDLDAQELRLQPRKWEPNQQAWIPATDAFHENHRKGDWWIYPLPDTSRALDIVKSAAQPNVQPPQGWGVFDPKVLSQYFKPLEEERAIRFFNGAVPSWPMALSTSVPRRKIVGALAAHLQEAEGSARPIVTLLLAAGCEGKTTALLQAAWEMTKEKPGWRILQRTDDAAPMEWNALVPLLAAEYRWLVLLDEADRIAKDLFVILQKIPAELQGRVHFLLASRDTDWLASRANLENWTSVCTFQQERLAGLDGEDAEAIVKAWNVFGARGLGDLAKIPEEQRVDILERQAREEARSNQGAFFGALLAVRHGSDLHNHARLMLERLGQRKIPSGGTLRNALAFIAAMHSEGLEFLSRPVLSQALSCPLEKLHRHVLAPLGQEAAATGTSLFIFTRHKRIATALVSVLENDFSTDIGALFKTLAMSAINSFKEGIRVPQLGDWRYSLPQHFFNKERIELAVEIARDVLSCEPENRMTLTSLANFYRKAGDPESAVKLFRESQGKLEKKDRTFFCEWATAEGAKDNQVEGALLAAYAISDNVPNQSRVNNDDAKMNLAGLGVSFGELFVNYHETAFRDAQIAVAVLGQQLHLDSETSGYFQNHIKEALADGAIEPDVDNAFNLFRQGVIAAEAIGVDAEVASTLPSTTTLTYDGLRKLVFATMSASG
ncbi:metallophosphoesterase [Thiovibrio frasassiensis]|uniref:Metallophosphoesterase n=1 Tax=Thiovibrio frasassiensis TaxID=2984131 RepID=A0A9X4MIJ7_9BACT|nr:metallophosphoesterase [Thiovibrio frasassiensis]MDG4477011.1 metallophosphoesterase [Thiovibrio frasassiensis]